MSVFIFSGNPNKVHFCIQLLKFYNASFVVVYIAIVLLSKKRSLLEIVLKGASNTTNANYIISCLNMFYDEDKCAEIFTYEEHKANIAAQKLFWFAFLVYVRLLVNNSIHKLTLFIL